MKMTIASPVRSQDTDGILFGFDGTVEIACPVSVVEADQVEYELGRVADDGNGVSVDECRGSAPKWPGTSPAARVRQLRSRREARRASNLSRPNQSISNQLRQAWARTGYPLKNVQCLCDDEAIVLSGCVTRFFYLQKVIEAARMFASGRKIKLLIEVVSDAQANEADV